MPTIDIEPAVRASLQTPKYARGQTFALHWYGRGGDECPPWWSPARDVFLSNFWHTEQFLSGAVYSVASRNAAFRFKLTGPERQVKACQEMCSTADLGRGWHTFISKVTQDLLTQDNGAFIEVIRPAKAVVGVTKKGAKAKGFGGKLSAYNETYLEAVRIGTKENGTPHWAVVVPGTKELMPLDGLSYTVKDIPTDAPIGIAHLDAQRCQRTGDLMYPVVYSDPQGKLHQLAYWQVITFEDMPSPRAEANGVGHSAVSRVLRAAQILRDISIYRHEKISGRFTGTVYLTNVDSEQVNDAVEQQQVNASNEGYRRYVQPLVISTLDPSATPHVERIDLASLPDNFNEDLTLRWYIASLALGLGVDYGFLAPLPGGGLGTASQSDTQERQARGKSSRLFMQMLAYKFNFWGVFPKSVEFEFQEPDSQEIAERDNGRKLRAETRKVRIEAGEITPQIARQIAEDDGDLDHRYLEIMGEGDITPEVVVHGGENMDADNEIVRPAVPSAQDVLSQATDPSKPQPAPQFKPGSEPPHVRAAGQVVADQMRQQSDMQFQQQQLEQMGQSADPFREGIMQGMQEGLAKAGASGAPAQGMGADANQALLEGLMAQLQPQAAAEGGDEAAADEQAPAGEDATQNATFMGIVEGLSKTLGQEVDPQGLYEGLAQALGTTDMATIIAKLTEYVEQQQQPTAEAKKAKAGPDKPAQTVQPRGPAQPAKPAIVNTAALTGFSPQALNRLGRQLGNMLSEMIGSGQLAISATGELLAPLNEQVKRDAEGKIQQAETESEKVQDEIARRIEQAKAELEKHTERVRGDVQKVVETARVDPKQPKPRLKPGVGKAKTAAEQELNKKKDEIALALDEARNMIRPSEASGTGTARRAQPKKST